MKGLSTQSVKALEKTKDQLKGYIDELLRINQSSESTFWENSTDYSVARDVLIASSGSISHSATKFSLLVTATLDFNQCTEVCSVILDPCAQMVIAVKVCLNCGIASILAKQIVSSALRILYALRKMVIASYERDNGDILPSLTGQVWEMCEAMQKTPRSNFIAVKRNMMEFYLLCKDTIEELSSMILSSTEQNETIDNSVEQDILEYDDKLEGVEIPRAKSIVSCLKVILDFTKMSISFLSLISSYPVEEECLQWVNLMITSYLDLSTAVIDISPSVYSPQDIQELYMQLDVLKEAGMTSLGFIKQFPGISESSTWNEIDNYIKSFIDIANECKRLCYSP